MDPTPTTSAIPVAADLKMPREKWLLIPSWCGSILFHGLLGATILYVSQFSMFRRPDIGGDGGDTYRYAGIEMLPPGAPGPAGTPGSPSGSPNLPAEPPGSPAANSPGESTLQPLPERPSSADPPVPLSLPMAQPSVAVLGPGLLRSLTTVDSNPLIRPANGGMGGLVQQGSGGPASFGSGGLGGSGTGTGGGGGGGTTFLGIRGEGKRFVYVIDRSFSMAADNALQAAKLELLSSLSHLDEAQQFQVIFYNTSFLALNTRGGRFDLFRGTDAQRLQVTEQIREIAPAEGTRHFPAIMEALNFKPDVIFLLSDGDAMTALDSQDLSRIRNQNRGKTHINCIEFGRSEKSHLGEAGNFLKVLARENGGQYIYRNLKTGF